MIPLPILTSTALVNLQIGCTRNHLEIKKSIRAWPRPAKTKGKHKETVISGQTSEKEKEQELCRLFGFFDPRFNQNCRE